MCAGRSKATGVHVCRCRVSERERERPHIPRLHSSAVFRGIEEEWGRERGREGKRDDINDDGDDDDDANPYSTPLPQTDQASAKDDPQAFGSKAEDAG